MTQSRLLTDSQGWPLDANDWPLPPDGVRLQAGAQYRAALTRARRRRTLRSKRAAARQAPFDFAGLSLKGIEPRSGEACSLQEPVLQGGLW
jgi:hypothetical protein